MVKRDPKTQGANFVFLFFLVMLDDTLAYLSIIAIGIWSNRELKKRERQELNKNSESDEV